MRFLSGIFTRRNVLLASGLNFRLELLSSWLLSWLSFFRTQRSGRERIVTNAEYFTFFFPSDIGKFSSFPVLLYRTLFRIILI